MKLVDKNKLVHSDDHNTTAGGIKQKNLDQIVNRVEVDVIDKLKLVPNPFR